MATKRRALSNVGGPVELGGDPELSALLGAALSDAEHAPVDVLTHGFHSYPARMHPAIAARLIDALSRPGDAVLDPFCGGGTVAVETLARGRAAFAADLNPLALRVTEVRTRLTDRAFRRAFAALVDDIAIRSEEHVRARASLRAPLSRVEAGWYSGHTLRELAGLWHVINGSADDFVQRALQMVFSAILVKFSRQRSDTAEEPVQKRIRKGLPTEFFARKADELIEGWAELRTATPVRTPAAELRLGDARAPQFGARFRAALVLSSPPYGGTYDYREHHARRYPWLDLDTRGLDHDELGARRRYADADRAQAYAAWDRELGAALEAAAAQLTKDGFVVWLLGDAQLAGTRVDARDQVARLAQHVGLVPMASASQQRTDFLGGKPRREHLLALCRAR